MSNSPLGKVDPVGLCDAVIGGITQSPTDPATEVQTSFANSIGANLSYPYAGGTFPGGFADVAGQGLTVNDSTRAAYASIMNSAAQNVSSRIGNVVYISPGNVSNLASGNTSTTVIANPLGAIDNVAGMGSTGNATLQWTNCGHNANCTFQQSGQLLKSKAGSPCSQPTTTSRANGGGGGGGGGVVAMR